MRQIEVFTPVKIWLNQLAVVLTIAKVFAHLISLWAKRAVRHFLLFLFFSQDLKSVLLFLLEFKKPVVLIFLNFMASVFSHGTLLDARAESALRNFLLCF